MAPSKKDTANETLEKRLWAAADQFRAGPRLTSENPVTRARIAIEDTLDAALPRAYSKEIYEAKCGTLFEHVYEAYQDDGSSVYSEAA